MDNCWDTADLPPDEIKLMLALTLVPGVGPATFRRLLDAFGSAQGVFGAVSDELRAACPHLKPESLAGLISGPNLRAVRHQEESCQRLGVRIVAYRSPAYPAPLLSLPFPVPFLFMQGEWRREDGRALAVVGTRYPSSYGKDMARKVCLGLAESGFTVVSGLARGIDTVAHEATLAGGGRTAAVLGSGLDWIYPNENMPLARRIAQQGCLISEFPMGTAPHATHFPRRNRLISALSMGTLVVEAGNESGALITAEFALEQGREIFAVPGPVHNPGARGPHKLIQEGAHLAESHVDIIRVLQGMSQAVPARRVLQTDEGPSAMKNGSKAIRDGRRGIGEGPLEKEGLFRSLEGRANVAVLVGLDLEAASKVGETEESNSAVSGLGLDGESRVLLSVLGSVPMSLDAISAQARMKAGLREAPAHRLLAGLLELELKGKVKRMPGALFQRA